LIWGTPAEYTQSDQNAYKLYSARTDGEYFIDRQSALKIQHRSEYWSDNYKVRLTNWLLEQRRSGVKCPEIFETNLDEIEKKRQLSVQGRADNLLRYLYSKNELLGDIEKFKIPSDKNYLNTEYGLLAWTNSIKISEVVTLSEYCNEMQWIEHRKSNQPNAELHELMLKPKGYARLAELDGTNINSKQAFVAMWFDPSMVEAYKQGIKLGIEDAGYDAFRIDEQDHNDKIDDQIIAEIRRSRFLVADFTQGETGARGGVYYEAGFAHGLNIPVIFTCRKDVIEKVHFDTRQYNHIVWETFEELRTRLSQRISATIGDGPNKTR
jgi:nucleoside 2-deoxyribosyltransferase